MKQAVAAKNKEAKSKTILTGAGALSLFPSQGPPPAHLDPSEWSFSFYRRIWWGGSYWTVYESFGGPSSQTESCTLW